MTETMPTSEVLNRAADLIEERGWWSPRGGEKGKGYERICAGNAIYDVAAHDIGIWKPAQIVLANYLGRKGHHLDTIWSWNDAEGRTAREVVETFRACAVIEASRERESVSA